MPKSKKKPKPHTWDEFRTAYELEVVRLYMQPRSEDRFCLAINTLERICKPKLARDITVTRLNKFIVALEQEGYARSTIVTHISYIKPMLDWGYMHKILPEAVQYDKRLLRNMRKQMPSRAVTQHEFDEILAEIVKSRASKGDASRFVRLMKAMNNCDLRISELLNLSWEPEAKVRMMVMGDRPLIQFCTHNAQKNGEIMSHPVSKKFWDIVSCDADGNEINVDKAEGLVFPMLGDPHIQMNSRTVMSVIQNAAHRANVVTNPHTGATATSKDIGRKAYIEKLRNAGIGVFELRKLVRHASIETTTKYYDFSNAYELGKNIGWE